MKFWLFMILCNLIVPLLMIAVGHMLKENPPERINMVFGYRTSRSMENQEAWDFAQVYCGKLWWKIGWIMLPFSIFGMFPAVGRDDDFIGWLGAGIIIVECMVMMLTTLIVESALKKKFGK